MGEAPHVLCKYFPFREDRESPLLGLKAFVRGLAQPAWHSLCLQGVESSGRGVCVCVGVLQRYEAFEDHVLMSAKAGRKRKVDEESQALLAEQMQCSCKAFVTLCCHWAVKLRMLAFREVARATLVDAMFAVIGRRRINFDFALADLGDLKEPVCVDSPSAHGKPCCHAEMMLERVVGGVHAMDACQFLIDLYQAQESCGRLRRFFGHAASVVAGALDGAIRDVGQEDPLLLPVSRGAKRAINLDPNYGQAVFDKVRSGAFRNANAVVRGLGLEIDETTSLSFEKHEANDYFWSVASKGASTLRWNVSMDASRLGGEDTSAFSVWWPSLRLGAWLLPQAHTAPRTCEVICGPPF